MRIRKVKREPSELETTAQRVHELKEAIQSCRNNLRYCEQNVINARDTLKNVLMEHQDVAAKLKELSAVPQPLP